MRILTITIVLILSNILLVQAQGELISLDFESKNPGYKENIIDDITINVISNTNTGVVFDSSNPTGGDIDLGTPNEDFGGSGIGEGGNIYEAYQNDLPMGNIYVIAENIIDSDNNGLIDNPDDDVNGGEIEFIFPVVTNVAYLWVVDNESDNSSVRGYNEAGNLVYEQAIFNTGDNGVILVGVFNPDIKKLVVFFDGSAAVGSILYNAPILPVVLNYFRGYNESGLHILEWESESEEVFDYYEVEESKDSRKWKNIGLVKGRGASKYTRRYIPDNGLTYYRLKMVDLNGHTEYSPIISIEARQSFHSKVLNMEDIHFYNILQQQVTKDTPGVLLFTYEGKTYKFLNRLN